MSVNILKNESRLPSAYQEVEYIESTGAQYIDTNYIPNQDTLVNCHINMTSYNGNDVFFGQRVAYMDNQYEFVAFNSQYVPQLRYNNQTTGAIQGSILSTGEHYIETSKNGLFIDNSRVGNTLNADTFTCQYSIYLFARNNAGTASAFSNIKLYSLKISENNTLVRDFIPCYRKLDNEIGLYDLVNGVFYSNSGSGTFTKGNDTPHTIKRVKPYLIKSNSQLPDGYTEVTYLQGSGTQYIDTGIKLSHNDTIKCKFEVMSTPSSYGEGIYGTMESISSTNTFFVLLMRSPNLARVGTSSNQVTSTNIALNKIYDTELSNGTYIENGTTYTFTPSTGFSFNSNCYLFKRNQSSMIPIPARVYSFEIVGRFKGIPCYRNSDNVAGIYDTVSKTFFTNAGTGTFSVGTKVKIPSEYQQVEYIESTGTQYIDTGVIGNQNINAEAKFVLTELTQNNNILSSYGSSSNTRDYLISSSGTNYFRLGYGSELQASSIPAEVNKVYTFKTNITSTSQEIVVNNVSALTINTTQTFTSSSLTIFANNQNGTKQNYSKANLYYLKIFDGTTLVRNFIPCYRKSDNEIGLYDLVNDVFYTNSGTGTFTKGANVSSFSVQPVKINILSNKSNNLLNINRREWNAETKNPTDLVTFDYNKLYYMASSGYIRNASIADLSTNPSTGSVSFTQGSSSWWGVGYPIEVKPNTKYTISGSRTDGDITKFLYCLYNSDGSFSSYAQVTTNTSILDMSLTITTGANTKTMCIVVAGITNNTNVSISNLQVEEGQTKTSFKHYGYDIIKI